MGSRTLFNIKYSTVSNMKQNTVQHTKAEEFNPMQFAKGALQNSATKENRKNKEKNQK